MTAPRRPRSAWLLVGSTPSVAEGPEGGQAFEEVARELGVVRGLGALAGGALQLGPKLRLERRDPGLKRGPVTVLLELLPGLEQLVRDGQTC